MTTKTKDPETKENTEPTWRPTMEDLQEWMDDSGCLSACIHEAWVEHDGHCPECGAQSWFLRLGLI